MTALLYKRKATVVVDSLRVDDLRVQFKAELTNTPEPNTLDLSITNLSKDTRSQMQKKGARVIVLAGYDAASGGAGVQQVFAGDARTIDHVRRGPDWITRVQCGDGERAYQFGRVNLSLGPGASLADVVKGLASQMGVGVGNALEKLKGGNLRGALDAFASGYAASGKGAAELDNILRSAGFEWSIQNGALQLLRSTESLPGTVVSLSADTGLVGSPEHGTPDKKGDVSVLKVRCLLRPELRPGRRVQVDALETKGLYRVEKATHFGDTAGNEWYSDLELKPA